MKDTLVYFHMNQLGDLLFSLPVLAGARKQWPEKKILSVVRPALAPLLTASGLVDAVVPRYPGLAASLRLVADLRRDAPATAVLFSESPASVLTARASAIPRRLGFRTASLDLLLTETVERSGVPSLQNNRELGVRLGLSWIPDDYTGLIKIPDMDNKEALRWLDERSIPAAQTVLLSPGASKRRKDKCWDPARWAQLADRIAGAGLRPVVIGAPFERDSVNAIVRSCTADVPAFFAENGILSLAALMHHARVFVGIDSGAMHLAAAGETPVIALFAATDPAQVGPRPAARHQIVAGNAMDAITVEDVWNALKNTRVC